MAGIEFIDIHKQYLVEDRAAQVLNGINLQVPSNWITMIPGRSGRGRTTLLHLAGSLEGVDQGEIRYGGSRRIAFVFQGPRLMSWFTVWNNIRFGLGKKRQDSRKITSITATAGLDGFEKAYPSQLPGGVQQRTATARALAYKPSFIMMDRSFTALDYFIREQTQKGLMQVQKKQGSSILSVTHNIDEAPVLGYRIVVIEEGLVEAQYQAPETIGERNLPDDMFTSLKRDITKDL